MNKFIFQIFRHLLLTLSLLSVYILIFDIFYNDHYKDKLFSKDLESTKILITGTSHTLFGLDPNLFAYQTLNISEINKPIIIDLEIIKKYHKKIPSLEYIIIPIDYFTLFYNGDSDANAKRYWHHWVLKNKNSSLFHFYDCQIATPIDLITPKNKLSNFTKVTGIYDSLNDKTKMLKRIDAWHNHWMSFENHLLISQEIHQFINFCKSKNINIIFVQMPTPSSTQNQFKPKYTSITSKNLQLFSNYSNTFIVNYNNFSVFNNDSLFMDCDHLNFEGAKIASWILNNEILTIASKSNQNHQGSN
jgi:hypothetical protein